MNTYNLEVMNASIPIILASLEESGTSPATIKGYRHGYSVFSKYLEKKDVESINEEIIFAYLHERTGVKVDGFYGYYGDDKLNLRMRPLHLLMKYLETGKVCFKRRNTNPQFQCLEGFKEAYEGFAEYLSDSQLSSHACRTNKRHSQKFLTFLFDNAVESLELLELSHIDSFLMTYKDNTIKYRGTVLYVLRKFFGYLYDGGFTISDFSELLPNLRVPRAGSIPHAWKKDQLQSLLGAIDRENPTGKRDYAMLLLIMHTGLRFTDIRSLRFKNINWSTKKISIVTNKTDYPLELPLLETVGWAIIDYIKNGRPVTSSDCIFIRHRPPYTSLGGSAGINKAMHRYLVKSGVYPDIKGSHGVHSLRNTLAKNMLETGVSLPIISQMLGHQSLNTTAIYLKIDIEELRKCALDPEEVFAQ